MASTVDPGPLRILAAALFLGTATMTSLMVLWVALDGIAPLAAMVTAAAAVATTQALARRPIAAGSRTRRLLLTALTLTAVLAPVCAAVHLLDRPDAIVAFVRTLEWLLAATIAYQALPETLYAAWRSAWR